MISIDERFASIPAFREFGRKAREVITAGAREMRAPAGTLVFEMGQACTHFIVVLSGSVRVHLLDAEGHEIVLYRLGPGDTCVLTTAALLGNVPYAAYAVTEGEVSAVMIPVSLFDELMDRHSDFRRVVFASHAGRIVDLMQVVSDVAFTRIHIRLALCLLRQAQPDGHVPLTHEALAVEIGSAREVVSRNLKMMEREGLLLRGQGGLRILDCKALSDLAGIDRCGD